MIKKIDHIVITTADAEACTAFYQALGFTAENHGHRWELFASDFKINVHLKGRELDPKALHVQTGSADLCFETDEPLPVWRDRLTRQGIALEQYDVARTGARGSMRSLYLRDPDGNLIELCHYPQARA